MNPKKPTARAWPGTHSVVSLKVVALMRGATSTVFRKCTWREGKEQAGLRAQGRSSSPGAP